MPLPNLRQQCTAQNRNKQRRCLNPAAFGCKTCRYHGARRQIAKGTDHPNYKHGNRSQDAIKSFSKASQELDMIEDMAESIGMVASRRRGTTFEMIIGSRWPINRTAHPTRPKPVRCCKDVTRERDTCYPR